VALLFKFDQDVRILVELFVGGKDSRCAIFNSCFSVTGIIGTPSCRRSHVAYDFFHRNAFIRRVHNRNQPRLVVGDSKHHIRPDRIGRIKGLLYVVVACPVRGLNGCRPAPR
jgi:hypothetical protein